MTNIAQLMTPNPVSISLHSNLHKARMLMAEHKIRHLPVVDHATGLLAGLISQKHLLFHAIKTIQSRGFERLEHEEKSKDVASIMDPKIGSFDIGSNLSDVAQFLTSNKSGCAAITENNKLVGVITSQDFVKLALKKTAG